MTDITAVLNLHSEGRLCYPTIKAYLRSIKYCRLKGHTVQPLVVLDNGTQETINTLALFKPGEFELLKTSVGDLGLARNEAIKTAKGKFIAFLDGDDLWSESWLTEVLNYDWNSDKETILHPEFNVYFGDDNHVFRHRDMEDPEFDLNFLLFDNYWTALSAGKTRTYLNHPYKPNRLKDGLGFEDWSWNVETIESGVVHKIVHNSVHFIRRKSNSLLKDTLAQGCIQTTALNLTLIS